MCEHDQRFQGVFSLPPACNGCLACFAETQANQINQLYAFVNSMDELIERISIVVSIQLPSIEMDLAKTLGEWQHIKKQIELEHIG